jgi:glycosyltransferase involved in cell wall biosynthesis
MASPWISLLVPVFNRQELLRPCLDSALAQTVDDLEVVVVDGASTDGTWDVCREYAAADSRVRIVREAANSGPVRGWARCLQEANGRLATFLWSDDALMPTFLERTTHYLADESVAFAYTAAEVGTAPGAGRVRYSLPPTGLIPSEDFLRESLRTRGKYPVSPACALFRLEDLRANLILELPDPPLDLTSRGAGTDLLFFLLAAAARPSVAHVAEPLAFFREHPGSISTEGRTGRVPLDYALTKVWFARGHGRADLVPTIMAWHWLGRMRATRRVISPMSAAREYDGLVSAGRLTGAAVGAVASLVADRFKPARRNRSSG